MQVAVTYLGNWSEAQKAKCEAACHVIGVVLSHPDFDAAILNFKHEYWARPNWFSRQRKYVTRLFADENNWFTIDPKLVLQTVKRAEEELLPGTEGVVDLHLKVKPTNLVGYTYPDVVWQVIGTWVFNSYDKYELANNLVHEWAHKLGFDHSFRRHARWPLTVPYWLGDTVERMGRRLVP